MLKLGSTTYSPRLGPDFGRYREKELSLQIVSLDKSTNGFSVIY